MTYTETDFEQLSWHDCHLWGLAFRAGDANDLVSELVLDIDFIVEWLCGVDGKATVFRVAPASLVFHDVTDLRIGIDWGAIGFPVAISPASVETIERECVPDRMVYPARPYYHWQIRFSWPPGAEIVFKSVGFTQTLRAEPVVSETQHLLLRQR
jgi:hypothetical protein